MTLSRSAGFLLVIEVLLSAASASAQTPRDFDSRHGAALALFAGGTSGSSGTGPAFGWSIGWVASRRVTLEGADSQVRPLAVFGVHVTYHFAEDPVTPDRR